MGPRRLNVCGVRSRKVEVSSPSGRFSTSQIFPVSAQKGLLAKINGDTQLLDKSRLLDLERALSDELISSKQQIVRDQTRVYDEELPTDGYAIAKFFASYSFNAGGVLNTMTARLDNATDRLYRNHLNYLKDVLPEMGRSFRLVYSVGF